MAEQHVQRVDAGANTATLVLILSGAALVSMAWMTFVGWALFSAITSLF